MSCPVPTHALPRYHRAKPPDKRARLRGLPVVWNDACMLAWEGSHNNRPDVSPGYLAFPVTRDIPQMPGYSVETSQLCTGSRFTPPSLLYHRLDLLLPLHPNQLHTNSPQPLFTFWIKGPRRVPRRNCRVWMIHQHWTGHRTVLAVNGFLPFQLSRRDGPDWWRIPAPSFSCT